MTSVKWQSVKDYNEIIFERADKIAKITMNRPEKMNAFTPVTIQEMIDAFNICRDDSTIGVIILTGAGDKRFHQAAIKVFVEMVVTLGRITLPA